MNWNLTPLFKSDTDPAIAKYLQEHQQATDKFIQKWRKRNDYLADSKVLKQALDEYQQWNKQYGYENSAIFYFWLRRELDQNNPQLQALYNKIDQQNKAIINKMQFFELQLAKIDAKTQKQFLQDKSLSEYHHFLTKLFEQAKYILSEAEEKILVLKSGPAYSNWVQMTSSLLAKAEKETLNDQGQKDTLNFSTLIGLVDHPQKKIRDQAAKTFNQILSEHLDIAEKEMNAILLNKQIDDQIRGYSRPDAARHLHDDIDSSVVDQLVKAVSDNYATSQRFYKLKAKLLKLPKLQYHERNLPYGKDNQKYSFEQAVELTKTALGQVDPFFNQVLDQYIQNGQIDVYPKKGKDDGAFCAHGLLIHPVYILLNFNNKLEDVCTLAHELGHAINDELMRKAQTALYFGTSLTTAEVASTFMEDFVLDQIIKDSTEEQRLAILIKKVNDSVSTIFRQVAMYQFETELHQQFREKGYLSAAAIGAIFQKYMKAYMGSAVAQNPGAENWWLYVGHFRHFFYVYSYAGGLLISKSLQASVKKDPQFIEKVKQFLSAGTSESPENIFAKLDVNIRNPQFWQNGIDEINQQIKEIEKLAKKLKKI